MKTYHLQLNDRGEYQTWYKSKKDATELLQRFFRFANDKARKTIKDSQHGCVALLLPQGFLTIRYNEVTK